MPAAPVSRLALASVSLRGSLRRGFARPASATFSTSRPTLGDIGTEKTHVTDKVGGHKDVQSESSDQAHRDRASGGGASQATSQKDAGDNNKRAEEDHPEAPKPVIGMNDERGGSGH